MGHVQDSPVSTNMISIGLSYDRKYTWSAMYDFGQKKFRIHILPIDE